MASNSGKHQDEILILSYLKALAQKDRSFFLFVLIAMSIQLILVPVKLEVTPFFLFGMFSEKIPAIDTVVKTVIVVNGKRITPEIMPLREYYLLETNAQNYIDIIKNNGKDPVQSRFENYPSITGTKLYSAIAPSIFNTDVVKKEFPLWFRNKVLSVTKELSSESDQGSVQPDRVDIIECTYFFDRNTNLLSPVKQDTLASF